ncbi:hypothetical protein OsJ_17052 [Oryza sativa Japonica Group]|uniref:Uncharacterized protein n=1 Tax=Oryza sativa subsp. japonica TaxID=39947 RepID=B9FMC6_ORYSJ|nr:hypothetical protein OsJ_17052 [Oryza sativa Japonica Group]
MSGGILLLLLLLLLLLAAACVEAGELPPISRRSFPKGFIFGTSSASYQKFKAKSKHLEKPPRRSRTGGSGAKTLAARAATPPPPPRRPRSSPAGKLPASREGGGEAHQLDGLHLGATRTGERRSSPPRSEAETVGLLGEAVDPASLRPDLALRRLDLAGAAAPAWRREAAGRPGHVGGVRWLGGVRPAWA